eukprot:COSAG01_NODE_4632_length_4861_cov_2.222596_9_plen_46_part_00
MTLALDSPAVRQLASLHVSALEFHEPVWQRQCGEARRGDGSAPGT